MGFQFPKWETDVYSRRFECIFRQHAMMELQTSERTNQAGTSNELVPLSTDWGSLCAGIFTYLDFLDFGFAFLLLVVFFALAAFFALPDFLVFLPEG